MTPKKLREVMEEHHLNVKKTAALLHVSEGAIYHWRNGTRPISQVVWDCLLLKLQKAKSLTIIGNEWCVQ